jgi:hypothetical protein
MEKIFEQIMEGFFCGMTEEDKQKMKACCTKMAATYPCCNIKDMSEEDKKAMMEKMQSFCGDKSGVMSSFARCAGLSK